MVKLHYFDKFGKTVSLNIDREGQFTTKLGGVLTILVYLGFLVATWYFGQDIYLRQSPNVVKKQDQLKSYPFIKLNKDNFFFALRISANNKPLFDPTIMEIEMDYLRYIREKGVIRFYKKSFSGERCDTRHISAEPLKRHGLNNYFCSNITGLKFGGSYDNGDLHLVSYTIHRCRNKTAEKKGYKCKSREEINKILSDSGYLNIYIFKALVNPHNFIEPVKLSYNYNFKSLRSFNLDENHLYTKNYYNLANVTSDTGLLFSDESTYKEFLEYRDSSSEIRKSNSKASIIASYSFFISDLETRYLRVYLKIPEAIAVVGGFMEIFLPFIETIYSFYLDHAFSLFLFSKLFKLEIEPEINPEKSPGLKEISKKLGNNEEGIYQEIPDKSEVKFDRKSIEINGPESNFPKNLKLFQYMNQKDRYVLNKELNSVIEFKRKQRDKVEISYWERITFIYCFCCKNIDNKETKIKYEMQEAANDELSEKLDILEHIRNIYQLRLFYKLFLNENQRYMLKHRDLHLIINNPFLKENEVKAIKDERENLQKENLKVYLKNLTSENSVTSIDRLLFKYIEDSLKKDLDDVCIHYE